MTIGEAALASVLAIALAVIGFMAIAFVWGWFVGPKEKN